jgi:prefoldin subunit 5
VGSASEVSEMAHSMNSDLQRIKAEIQALRTRLAMLEASQRRIEHAQYQEYMRQRNNELAQMLPSE